MDRKISSYDWSIIDKVEDPSDGVRQLNDALWSMYNDIFPLIKIRMSYTYQASMHLSVYPLMLTSQLYLYQKLKVNWVF